MLTTAASLATACEPRAASRCTGDYRIFRPAVFIKVEKSGADRFISAAKAVAEESGLEFAGDRFPGVPNRPHRQFAFYACNEDFYVIADNSEGDFAAVQFFRNRDASEARTLAVVSKFVGRWRARFELLHIDPSLARELEPAGFTKKGFPDTEDNSAKPDGST